MLGVSRGMLGVSSGMLGVLRGMLGELRGMLVVTCINASMDMSRIGQKFGKLSKRCFSNPLEPEKHEFVNEKFPRFRLHAEKWQKRRKSGIGGKCICPKVNEVRG